MRRRRSDTCNGLLYFGQIKRKIKLCVLRDVRDEGCPIISHYSFRDVMSGH